MGISYHIVVRKSFWKMQMHMTKYDFRRHAKLKLLGEHSIRTML
jgi:hypothetical protein